MERVSPPGERAVPAPRHEHGGHGHAAHHAAGHSPSPESLSSYQAAFDAAQPAPGGRVVVADLEAREVEWEFIPGKITRAWSFNGEIPGPVLEGKVGDVLEVRLRNSLPEPTLVHWHGLRLPSAMDGAEMVQRPIQPGETFVYRFLLPDAGTFWYHPHLHETVQLERGLYGAIVVRGPDEPTVDKEQVLVIDDVALDREGQIKPPGWWIEHHNGREGSTRLINGRSEPNLVIAAGQVERWRVVNASSARYIRLSIGDRPFRIIGTDGGLIPSPVTVSEVLLAPADRIDVAVGPLETEGELLNVESLQYRRGQFGGGIGKPEREKLASLRVTAARPSVAAIPERLRSIRPLVAGPAEPTREIRLDFKLSAKHGVDFLINREPHHRADPVKVGELQIWEIVNHSPVDHPFHLHGFFFQVLEVNGEPPPYLSWEDTINVPGRGRVRIAWMPEDRPGEWMFHCHILEHHANGMMAHFQVIR